MSGWMTPCKLNHFCFVAIYFHDAARFHLTSNRDKKKVDDYNLSHFKNIPCPTR